MANRLKKMKYSSVDMVKRGANPEAHFKLAKSIDDDMEGGETMSKGLFDKLVEAVSKSLGREVVVEKTMSNPSDEAFESSCAIYESFASIMDDVSIAKEDKIELMQKSLEEFTEDIQSRMESWADGCGTIEKSVENNRIEMMKLVRDRIDSVIKADEQDDDFSDDDDDKEEEDKDLEKDCKKKVEKGEDEDMMFDVNKMTPEDLETFNILKAKYSEEDNKGNEMHPEVKKALEEVEEMKKSLEMKEMKEIAKKYEVIGKSVDETAEKLYNLKKSSEEAYNSVIATYDEMLNIQNSTGIFKEYGSNRGGAGATDLMGIVQELRKSYPQASEAELVVKAYEQNPDLDRVTGQRH